MDSETGWVAVAAVIISAISFFWSGWRERASWRRDSRLQLYIEIIDNVYARLDGAYFALADRHAARQEGYETKREDELRLHELQMKLMYRLRLLGDSATLRRAIAVHQTNHAVIDLAFSSPEAPTDVEMLAYQSSMRANARALEDFYVAARRTFGLARLSNKSDAFWRYGDPLQAQSEKRPNRIAFFARGCRSGIAPKAACNGEVSLDSLTRAWIRERYRFRYIETKGAGKQAPPDRK